MGQLVRALPGLFNTRPADFAELAKQRELYFIFYTLNYALRDGQTEIVAHQPVPEWAQPYPLMRWSGAHDPTGKTIAWKIFNASDPLTVETHRRTQLIPRLTPEQERLSVHQLWPHPVLVKKLARGWTPERAEELRLQDVAEAAERKKKQPSGRKSLDKPMRHFLYFPKKLNAEKAGERLRDRGFSVEVRRGAGGEDWLALATRTPPNTGEVMEELRDEMEALAAELDGEYDGWELPLDSI
jgi:regulator of ribonuclease activity B